MIKISNFLCFVAVAYSGLAAPVIHCPSNIVIACEKASEPVEYEVTAKDDAGQMLPVVCSPESGKVFTLGLHRVLCTATDVDQKTSTCVFFVEVEDSLPPILACSSNLTVQAASAQGAIVTWAASANDDCGAASEVMCEPVPGSVFPPGRTAVLCTASDEAGNIEHCSFLVTVLPPPALRIDRLKSDGTVLLKWAGRQVLQETAELRATTPWKDSTLPVLDHNGELSLQWPNTGRSHFFRLRPVPFPDTGDADGDGVPDSRDRCRSTLPGTIVDVFGCSPADVVRGPDQLLAPIQQPWSQAAALLTRFVADTNPPFASAKFSGAMAYADQAMAQLTLSLESFRAGELCSGAAAYQDALTAWNNAQAALEFVSRETVSEWEGREPAKMEEGDVFSEESYLARLEALASDFDRANDEAAATLPAVQRACEAVGERVVRRGRVLHVDDAARLVKLDTGISIIMPARELGGQLAEGAVVDVSGMGLNDGSLIAMDVTGPIFSEPGLLFPKTVLRIAPIQPFPPEGSGPFTLHAPEAYEGNYNRLTLERGMRLAAASVGGYSGAPESSDSLSLGLRYEKQNGAFATINIAAALEPGDVPVNIPEFGSDKKFLGDEWIVVTVRRRNPTNDRLAVLSTTNIPVRIAARGRVCWANYDETQFEMPDANVFPPASVSTHVNSITQDAFLFKPVDAGTTPVFQFRNWNGQLRAGTNPFLILNDFDPSGFDPGVYNDGASYQRGVRYPAGITWPRYKGKRNQQTFWYSVDVPRIVRDRVSSCNGSPNSFYKLPLDGGWPTWRMGQGNMNPDFTHAPGTYNQYAFDFLAPQNTPILAARGGTVLAFIESRLQNCWNSLAGSCIPNCQRPNWLKILHQDGTVGVYMHMPQNSINLSVRDRVFRGDAIAIVGNTGCSSTPHLHFQVDPENDPNVNSMQISFEAYHACAIFEWPMFEPCGLRQCYIPVRNEILFSTQ